MGKRGRPAILAPTDSDATTAARHLCVLLATDNPALWPVLNVATLAPPIDWPRTLRLLLEAMPQQ